MTAEEDGPTSDLSDKPLRVSVYGEAVLIWPNPLATAMTAAAARTLAESLLAAAVQVEGGSPAGR